MATMTDEMQRFGAKFLAILNSHLPLSNQIIPSEQEMNPLFRLYKAYHSPTYADSERRYHTFAHVLDCVQVLDDYADELGISDQNYNLLFMALAYHDAIYRTDPLEDIEQSNEEASAAFAVQELEAAGMPSHFVNTISKLILATDHRKMFENSSKLELIIRDIDLAGLAVPWESFANVSEDVRYEYGCIEDEAYRHGRAAFIGKILNQRHIYACWELREQWEDIARENLKRHLTELQGR